MDCSISGNFLALFLRSFTIWLFNPAQNKAPCPIFSRGSKMGGNQPLAPATTQSGSTACRKSGFIFEAIRCFDSYLVCLFHFSYFSPNLNCTL